MQQKNSERIQVVVRARPINQKEIEKGYNK
jgi:hypothetical protein